MKEFKTFKRHLSLVGLYVVLMFSLINSQAEDPEK
jgi:hypothetical protein